MLVAGGLPDGSRDIVGARELVRDALGELAPEARAAGVTLGPDVQSAMEEALASTDPLVAPFAQQMVEGGASVPVTPNFGAVQAKKTTNSMIQAILGGQKDVATATKDAAAEMTELLNK